MTLPASGYIGLAHVNQELGRPLTQFISMNDPDVRRLAGAPSGLIWMSQLHGKSNIIREPASGEFYDSWTSWEYNGALRWGGVTIARNVHGASYTSGVWTYFKSSARPETIWRPGTGDDNNGWSETVYSYAVWRQRLGP